MNLVRDKIGNSISFHQVDCYFIWQERSQDSWIQKPGFSKKPGFSAPPSAANTVIV
ncbi:MAG: hypothetical protein F6J93_26110 [Oscillatoria sp. SIO1A7]|nr:hypothetical protein [Oscillatoria sp. SIO1A7]